jgi:hypothetical protein
MKVIGFLCVLLGSSTVQLHDSLGSRSACACLELVSVVKIATALEECITEEQPSLVCVCVCVCVCVFFVARRTQCKGYL